MVSMCDRRRPMCGEHAHIQQRRADSEVHDDGGVFNGHVEEHRGRGGEFARVGSTVPRPHRGSGEPGGIVDGVFCGETNVNVRRLME
jgi:hypothetical protein